MMEPKFENAINILIALACCSIPELTCSECPCKCDAWSDAEVIEAVKILKERNSNENK